MTYKGSPQVPFPMEYSVLLASERSELDLFEAPRCCCIMMGIRAASGLYNRDRRALARLSVFP